MIDGILNRQAKHGSQWHDHAAVGKHHIFLSEIRRLEYDNSLCDFPEQYLPFYESDKWEILGENEQKNILSFAWLLYNLKTIVIEQSVLTEYCQVVLSRESKFTFSSIFSDRIAQVQVDEAYHTLMSYAGIEKCQRLEFFDFNKLPQSELTRYISSLNSVDSKSRELALLALTTVCEVTISKYLSAFPKYSYFQPAFRFITETHRRDEMSHSALFIDIVSLALNSLSVDDKTTLKHYLKEGIRVITLPDKRIWEYIFNMQGIGELHEPNPEFKTLYSFKKLNRLVRETENV